MGAGVFHGRVRDGNGCSNPAMATRPPHQMRWCVDGIWCVWLGVSGGGQQPGVGVKNTLTPDPWLLTPSARLGAVRGGDVAITVHCLWIEFDRAIRTARLNGLPHVYPRPIDVMVYHGPQGDLVLRLVSRLDAFSGYPFRT